MSGNDALAIGLLRRLSLDDTAEPPRRLTDYLPFAGKLLFDLGSIIMSIDATAVSDADQTHVDAAYQRLAVALAEERPASDATSPADVEGGHAVVGAARVELVEAEVANAADQAKSVPAPQSDHGNGPRGPAHLVEFVV